MTDIREQSVQNFISNRLFIYADLFGSSCVLSSDNILYRKIDGEWIGKMGIQVKPNGKGFQMKWEEDIIPTDVICD